MRIHSNRVSLSTMIPSLSSFPRYIFSFIARIGKRTTFERNTLVSEPRFYFHYQLNSIIQHPTRSCHSCFPYFPYTLSLFNLSQRSPSNPLISTNSISNHPRTRGKYASRIFSLSLSLSEGGGEKMRKGRKETRGKRDRDVIMKTFQAIFTRPMVEKIKEKKKKKGRSIMSGW